MTPEQALAGKQSAYNVVLSKLVRRLIDEAEHAVAARRRVSIICCRAPDIAQDVDLPSALNKARLQVRMPDSRRAVLTASS